jgi:hypothetical protein
MKLILNNDVWYIGDRIRDIMILDKKIVVMILDGDHLSQPSIGFLELI